MPILLIFRELMNINQLHICDLPHITLCIKSFYTGIKNLESWSNRIIRT